MISKMRLKVQARVSNEDLTYIVNWEMKRKKLALRTKSNLYGTGRDSNRYSFSAEENRL